ncbi:E3 ubiquitin-protein ligase MARCH2 isoform X2 [Mycetomoellerius zeteki]|uniref:E3 ubiquitin-protein ligase MARCH2 isoform X2 n=1 Tax=Mycetomoellerius zeteki TaxID=64791 RepID=UPI00084E4313|nr:PREDICTED: E3 ubiquitin-protein ligase MARCH2-like isoform X2 [Trachymyrmex zeteki]
MSHVEDAEPKNGSGRTNEIVANERDKFVAQASPESSVNVEIRISASKTNQILDNIKSDLETEENDEKCVDIKSQDKDNTCIASGDICRICHMGGYASITDNHPSYDTENLIDQTSILSNFVYLGPLISACKCRGTVALVHAECLERWLTESGRARCELCGYKYAIRRVRRYSFFQSVVIWFRTIIATRQMLLDIGYLVMTTPVAVFSCYLCALALKMLMRNGFYEIPWMIVAMLPTCLLTLIAYWRWIITLGRLHGHRWRRYWRNNFVVRLIPDNDIENSLDPRSSNDLFNVRDDFEQWRLEENDEFV